MSTETITATSAPMSQYRCPRHPEITLVLMLKGGAGFCTVCSMYQQALGVPMPVLPTKPPKPEKVKVKRARKAKAATTKVKRTRKVAAKLTATNVMKASQ